MKIPMKTQAMYLFLLLFSGYFFAFPPAYGSELIFSNDKKIVKRVKLSTLKDTLTSHDIEIFDYLHKKVKHYKSFKLIDVLEFAYGTNHSSTTNSQVSIIAMDGYKTLTKGETLYEDGGFLAYKDNDGDDWEKIAQDHDAYPGPFYLVWSKSHQTPENGYPWPWQTRTFLIIGDYEEEYASIIPTDLSDESPAVRGYEIFKKSCISCHALNKIGGDIGPDLDAPTNILSYRNRDFLKKFIKQSSSIRYSKMPDFTYLSDQDLDDVVTYLGLRRKH